MKYDIVTVGGATEDFSFYTHEGRLIEESKAGQLIKQIAFDYGAKIGIDRVYSTFGGGAANTAVNLAGLGFKTAAVLALGDDERGREVINNLRRKKVATALVKQIKGDTSGFSFIVINKNNERIIFSHRGANTELRLGAKDLAAIKSSGWVYIASLSGKYWQSDLKKIFSLPRVRKIWNPGQTQLAGGRKQIAKFLEQTDIFCLNKDEALELVVASSVSTKKMDIKKLLLLIQSWGPKMVVITNGRQGADLYDGARFYHQAIVQKQKRRDTTGVGDAFHSSFWAGLELYRGDIKRALRLAVLSTASVVSKVGAQNGLLIKADLTKYKI